MMNSQPHRIVIAGGGVAGLDLASSLARRWQLHRRESAAFSVTLVDRSYSHVWKPMLHTIAAGTRDVSQQQTSYVAHASLTGFQYQPGEILGLDRRARKLHLGALLGQGGRVLIPPTDLPYDTLILAIGSQAQDFGTPGVDQHCWKIDSLEEADQFNLELRNTMLECLTHDFALNIAIVGGGATGVELAAELVQLTGIAEAYGAHGLGERITITLIDSGPRLLQAFPEDISRQALQRLETLGITVLQNARVASADAGGFTLADGRVIPAALKVWATGVKAADFLQGIGGLETDASNRLQLRPSLQTTRDNSIYAIGDCARCTPGASERPLPPTAQVASQQAAHLARHLPAALEQGRPVPDFAYRDFGALVSLSDYDAYGSLGQYGFFKGSTFRGKLAHLSHALLYRQHQARVHGFWRGGLLWIVDALNRRLRPQMRLD